MKHNCHYLYHLLQNLKFCFLLIHYIYVFHVMLSNKQVFMPKLNAQNGYITRRGIYRDSWEV